MLLIGLSVEVMRIVHVAIGPNPDEAIPWQKVNLGVDSMPGIIDEAVIMLGVLTQPGDPERMTIGGRFEMDGEVLAEATTVHVPLDNQPGTADAVTLRFRDIPVRHASDALNYVISFDGEDQVQGSLSVRAH